MILTTKNKMQQSLDALIDQAEKVKGIPDKFVSTKKEFGQILVELNKNGKQNEQFVFGGGNPPNIMEVYRQKLTQESVNKLINRWAKGEFEVKYRDILLTYKTQKVVEKMESEAKDTW